MKNITMATEIRINNMVKQNIEQAKALLYILNQLKSRSGWLGATIAEMKKYGYTIENDNQVKVYVSDIMRGMAVNFEELFNAVDCCDLHYVTLRDFNKLTLAIQSKYAE